MQNTVKDQMLDNDVVDKLLSSRIILMSSAETVCHPRRDCIMEIGDTY